MKKLISLCMALLLLLALTGCGQENSSTPSGSGSHTDGSQSSQTDGSQSSSGSGSQTDGETGSIEDQIRVEGGVTLAEFVKNLEDMGYHVLVEPLDYDDSVYTVSAGLPGPYGTNVYRFQCDIWDTGKLVGFQFMETFPNEEYDRNPEVFPTVVAKYFEDICKAAPTLADTFATEYIVSMPDELFDVMRGDDDYDSSHVLPGVEPSVILTYLPSAENFWVHYLISRWTST